jgi:hypothetical protein
LSLGAACTPGFDAGDFQAGAQASAAGPGGSGSGAAAASGSGAGGVSNGGAGGGTVTGEPLADWTSSMLAVWRFDSLDLGVDSAGAFTLSLAGTPLFDDRQQHPQGPGAALLGDGDGFSSDDPALVPSASSFSMGTWIRVDAEANGAVEVMSRYEGDSGYSFDRDFGSALACFVGSGGAFTSARSDDNSWPDATWVHMVCVFDDERNLISAYLDGTLVATESQSAVAAAATGVTSVVSPDYSMNGALDELFVIMDPLGAAAVRRIYACGIDGARCGCDVDDPTVFLSCGSLESCQGLPPCNAAAP